MSSMLEMLRERKLAEEASAKALENAVVPTPDAPLAEDSVVGAMKMPSEKTIVEAASASNVKKGPPGSYRSLQLKRFFDAKGTKIEPNDDGFFIPANEEQARELAYFAMQYDMVEYQGDVQTSLA